MKSRGCGKVGIALAGGGSLGAIYEIGALLAFEMALDAPPPTPKESSECGGWIEPLDDAPRHLERALNGQKVRSAE